MQDVFMHRIHKKLLHYLFLGIREGMRPEGKDVMSNRNNNLISDILSGVILAIFVLLIVAGIVTQL